MILLRTLVSFTPASGGTWLLVSPERNGAYRVNAETKALCEALQTSNTLQEAHQRYQLASGNPLRFDRFSTAAQVVAARINTGRGNARRVMTIGFTLLPARLFKRIAEPFAFLIRGWLLAMVAVLLVPTLIVGLHGSSFSAAISDYREGLTGLVIVLGSVVFHEIGHAASLVKNHRIVGKLGAGVMLIFPAMFTEVLEHTVMSHREKLWLNVGGIYFQVIFGHFVLLAGWLLSSRACMDYALVVYLIAGFQLLPLNGQDGVWLISDLLPARHKWFQMATQVLSVVVAGAIIVPITLRVLVPYWQMRFGLFEAGYNPFADNLNINISSILISAIAVMWLGRVTVTATGLIRRRRTAGIVAAKQKWSIT